jgi:hypothetical protein
MPSPSDSNPKRDWRLYAQDMDRFAHRAVRYCADLNRTQFPHCQQRSPLGLTRPPGGPTDDHATAL